jgi:molecular chaperone GrpE (heat shock protein)
MRSPGVGRETLRRHADDVLNLKKQGGVESHARMTVISMEATEHDEGTPTVAEASELERVKLRREHDMHRRIMADFDNYRRRVDRERENADSSGTREGIGEMAGVEMNM